jgi:hypothetical protein
MCQRLSMERCDLMEQFTRASWAKWRGTSPSLLTLMFVLGAALFGAAATIAQTCEDDNPAHAAALIDQIRFSCERYDTPYSSDVYGLAAVADKEAIPALRKLAAWSTEKGPGTSCSFWVRTARIALAKMGDEQYRAGLNRDEASFIADDRALTTLIEFLVAHAKDPAMYVDFGDYGSDYRDTLLYEIDLIHRRRRMPDLPLADYSDAGILQWKAYLEKHKGEQMTFPAYPEVADPYLKCLARRVDWGFSDAILAIAAHGGDAALSILHQLPRPWKPDMMGYAVSAPLNPDWMTMQGNMQVALAQLGDEEMFGQIVAELRGGTAYQSVRKLEYLGGKRAVEALVSALDISEDAVQKARMKECGDRTYCYPINPVQWRQIWNLKPDGKEIEIEICRATPFHSCVVGVLGYMVKNPPLAPGAAATPENIRKWKEWWASNKDRAEFVVKPAPTFE